MSRKSKIKRSDAEEKEYYKGLVRKRDKRIKLLEREVSRLTKYLMRDDTGYDWDEEESKIIPPKPDSWICAVPVFRYYQAVSSPCV